MTTAFRGLIDRGRLTKGETAVIHGCGGVGISAIMIAKAIGARAIAVDVNDKALELAHQVGADEIINAGEAENVGGLVHEPTAAAHMFPWMRWGLQQHFRTVSGASRTSGMSRSACLLMTIKLWICRFMIWCIHGNYSCPDHGAGG